MKKLILVAVLAIISVGVKAQEELNWNTDVKIAVQESIKKDKPMIMFFTGSDWCYWCKKLDANVMNKKGFIEWANEEVILSLLDFPSKNKQDKQTRSQNGFLKNLLKIKGFPTIVFVKPKINENGVINLNEIGRLGYAKDEKKWITNAETILSKLKKEKKTVN